MSQRSIDHADCPTFKEPGNERIAPLSESACHGEHRAALEATLFDHEARDELIYELDQGELRLRATRL